MSWKVWMLGFNLSWACRQISNKFAHLRPPGLGHIAWGFLTWHLSKPRRQASCLPAFISHAAHCILVVPGAFSIHSHSLAVVVVRSWPKNDKRGIKGSLSRTSSFGSGVVTSSWLPHADSFIVPPLPLSRFVFISILLSCFLFYSPSLSSSLLTRLYLRDNSKKRLFFN